jgi:hypothetical protein
VNTAVEELDELVGREYKEGFVTDIEAETLPPGLDESVIRFLSGKKIGTGLYPAVAAGGVSTLAGHGVS